MRRNVVGSCWRKVGICDVMGVHVGEYLIVSVRSIVEWLWV